MESLLSEAKKLEKRYEWLQAANHYKQASDFLRENEFKESAELHEKIGFCHYKAAFQADTNIQFKKQLENAIRNYKSIATILQNSAEKNDVIQTKNAEAMIAYINSWIDALLAHNIRLFLYNYLQLSWA